MIKNDDKQVPCIICSKMVERWDEREGEWIGKKWTNAPWQGVYILTNGNYGSQVFDTAVSLQYIFFVICDECIIRKSSSMLYRQKDGKVINAKEYFDKEFKHLLEDNNRNDEYCKKIRKYFDV